MTTPITISAPVTVTGQITAAQSVTAGLNVATTQIGNLVSGVLTSAFVTLGAPMLSLFAGTSTAHYAAGALFGLAGLGSLVTQVWSFLNHNSAVSSNTVATINNLTQLAGQAAAALGGPANPTQAA